MRILIFSDLHANWDALCALQAVEPQPNAVIFLGDAVGYGPEPKACVTWLRRHVQYAVRGEHDLAVADRIEGDWPPGEREIAQAYRDYTRRMLDESDLAYLRGLPEQLTITLGGATFYLAHKPPGPPSSFQGAGRRAPTPGPSPQQGAERTTHAAPRTPERRGGQSTEIGSNPPLSQDWERGLGGEGLILIGHTHLPEIRRVGQAVHVNPGSLGQPRHGSPSATYAVWQDGEVTIHHIDYDFRPTQRKLALLPLDPEYIEHLQFVLERGL